jgi:hypothetical protein
MKRCLEQESRTYHTEFQDSGSGRKLGYLPQEKKDSNFTGNIDFLNKSQKASF